MPRLPRDIRSTQLIAAFKRLGFKRSPAGKGSHRGYYRDSADGSKTIVTLLEGSDCITPGTLNAILKRAGISRQEFNDAL